MSAIPVRRQSTDVKNIVELLNDDSMASAEDMAVEILRAAFDSWRQRDWWTAAHFVDGKLIKFFGLEPTRKAIEAKASHLGVGEVKAVPLASIDKHVEALDLFNLETWNRYTDLPCDVCGHLEWAHGAKNWRGQNAPIPPGRPHCSVKCGCKQYEHPKDEG